MIQNIYINRADTNRVNISHQQMQMIPLLNLLVYCLSCRTFLRLMVKSRLILYFRMVFLDLEIMVLWRHVMNLTVICLPCSVNYQELQLLARQTYFEPFEGISNLFPLLEVSSHFHQYYVSKVIADTPQCYR